MTRDQKNQAYAAAAERLKADIKVAQGKFAETCRRIDETITRRL